MKKSLLRSILLLSLIALYSFSTTQATAKADPVQISPLPMKAFNDQDNGGTYDLIKSQPFSIQLNYPRVNTGDSSGTWDVAVFVNTDSTEEIWTPESSSLHILKQLGDETQDVFFYKKDPLGVNKDLGRLDDQDFNQVNDQGKDDPYYTRKIYTCYFTSLMSGQVKVVLTNGRKVVTIYFNIQ
jgi:hypothetical protein